MGVETKRCCKCRETLPRSEFYANKGRPDGIQTVCKKCTAANNRAWHDANPGSHIRHYAGRTLTDREIEDRKRRAADWHRANPERARENTRRWYERNPEAAQMMSRRRTAAYNARKLGLYVEDVDSLIVLELDDGVCGICGDDVDPFDFHVDHVIPLSRGGEHSYANTQVAHPSCNAKKWANPPEWAEAA